MVPILTSLLVSAGTCSREDTRRRHIGRPRHGGSTRSLGELTGVGFQVCRGHLSGGISLRRIPSWATLTLQELHEREYAQIIRACPHPLGMFAVVSHRKRVELASGLPAWVEIGLQEHARCGQGRAEKVTWCGCTTC